MNLWNLLKLSKYLRKSFNIHDHSVENEDVPKHVDFVRLPDETNKTWRSNNTRTKTNDRHSPLHGSIQETGYSWQLQRHLESISRLNHLKQENNTISFIILRQSHLKTFIMSFNVLRSIKRWKDNITRAITTEDSNWQLDCNLKLKAVSTHPPTHPPPP